MCDMRDTNAEGKETGQRKSSVIAPARHLRCHKKNNDCRNKSNNYKNTTNNDSKFVDVSTEIPFAMNVLR